MNVRFQVLQKRLPQYYGRLIAGEQTYLINTETLSKQQGDIRPYKLSGQLSKKNIIVSVIADRTEYFSWKSS